MLEVEFSGYNEIQVPDKDYDMYIWCYFLTPEADENKVLSEIEDFKVKLELVLNKTSKGNFLIFTLDYRNLAIWRLSSNWLSESISSFNTQAYEWASATSRRKVVNISGFLNGYGSEHIIDKKYYYLSKFIINPAINSAFQNWFRTVLNAFEGKKKKCLIVDLDNTLWGGILGEDGIEGIKLGNSYPGNCFLDFQQHIKESGKNGVLLAINSKNNEDDVWATFNNHPDIVLSKDDFVSYRINWQDKASNIREIANELNIGIDSIVFIDDNPAEREIIKQLEPQVIVPDFPEQPYRLVDFFLDDVYNKYFLPYSLTTEDQFKKEQYQANSLRESSSSSFTSIEDYILSLKTVISIERVNEFNVSRIAQLTQKTNQFNLTTKRYLENDILNLDNKSNLIFCASVSDRFGDSGITAAGIVIFKENEAIIDSYLLSCRILGREIEISLIKTVINYIYEQGVKRIKAKYIPTIKNRQTEDFYDKLGFSSTILPDGSKDYLLELREEISINNLSGIILNI